nr:ATP-binding cassette domain-containing protein [uncultured Celeribacter sp.]
MIETRNLCVHVANTPILKDVSLSIPKGKLTALVGPNGAGKSTLLSALGRMLEPASGSVLLDGRPLGSFAGPELARHLSILRQSTTITPRLTVADLVAFGRYPHSQGRLGEDDRAEVWRSIVRLDLASYADRFLDTLSGGQRQRSLIAMTLAQAADVVLLDEPLNNLDLAHARRVMRIAREEVEAGRTVVCVLHDLTVAAAHADHIIALKEGQLHAEGPPSEMITGPGLSDLYDAEVEVAEVRGRRVVLMV